MNIDFLKIEKETPYEFREIAEKLFDRYAIQTSSALYRLCEIEFYWNSPNHKDNSTYKRNHVNPKSGDWFFHYSCVDIALKNEETRGYGGILIRGLYDVDKNIIIKGPMVCAMKLFSGNNAFSQSIKTQVIPYSFDSLMITPGRRVNIGKNGKENSAHELDYTFSINPKK